MEFTEEGTYHIYNRGNKKQKIFFREENYLYFLKKVRAELLPYCEILAYCLMPNHFHFIVFIKSKKGNALDNENKRNKTLNNAIAILLRSYTRSMQSQEKFTGSLFQQKTKAKELIDTDNATINYISLCTHYIHFNPLKAKIVENLEEWKFSSYLDYMSLRNGTLCNRAMFYSIAGLNEDDFIKESVRHRMTTEDLDTD
ncbi:MAG: transposase [Pedobacter sp.]|nr:transposase [Pedobacter sp.]